MASTSKKRELGLPHNQATKRILQMGSEKAAPPIIDKLTVGGQQPERHKSRAPQRAFHKPTLIATLVWLIVRDNM